MKDSNPEIDALVARYGEDTVRAAFAIAQSIGDNGFDGIHFKRAAEGRMRQTASLTIRSKVESRIRQRMRS